MARPPLPSQRLPLKLKILNPNVSPDKRATLATNSKQISAMAATAMAAIWEETSSSCLQQKSGSPQRDRKLSSMASGASVTSPPPLLYTEERLRKAVQEWEDSSGTTSAPPPEFLCPLSLDVMVDPVVTASGQTYERAYVERWFREGHNTCPKNNLALQSQELRPHGPMREAIRNWCDKNGKVLLDRVTVKAEADFNSNSKGSGNISGEFLKTGGEEKVRGRKIEEIRRMMGRLGNGVVINDVSKDDKASDSCSMHQISVVGEASSSVGLKTELLMSPMESCCSHSENGSSSGGNNCGKNDTLDSKLPEESPRNVSVTDTPVQPFQKSTSFNKLEKKKKQFTEKKQLHRSCKSFAESSSPPVPILLRRHSFASLMLQREPSAPVDDEIISELLKVVEEKVIAMQSQGNCSNRPCKSTDERFEGKRLEDDQAQAQAQAQACDQEESSLEELQSAVEALWNLTKISKLTRRRMGELGVVLIILPLLSSHDALIQEYSITVLLNLALEIEAKVRIVVAGAVEPLVRAMIKGQTVRARENAAGAISSLTVAPQGRTAVRDAGAVPLLVNILNTGSTRARKDAAIGLFNLAIDTNCRTEIVHAGSVLSILKILETPGAFGVEEEVVALLATLSKTYDACDLLERMRGIRLLVGVLESGESEKARINATATLLQLANWNTKCVDVIKREGGLFPLLPLSQSTSPRGRDKASSLMRLLRAA